MKKKPAVIFGVAAAAVSVWWGIAQNAPAPLAGLFPAGAVLYLESKDFNSLLGSWNGSPEKTAWLKSSNYDAFSKSRLFLKLKDAQTDFAAAAGLPPDDALLSSVAGGNSALAIYDIGNLDVLYITHLASARALNTALWRARGTYQTRRAGNIDYYVKEDKTSHRTALFAYTGDLLLLGTKEDAMAGALQLIARVNRPSLAGEKWYADPVRAAAAGDHDLRLVYNMEQLVSSPHFRSYWVRRNVAAMREFSSGLADLDRAAGEIHEQRVLIRATAGGDQAAAEPAAGQLLALVPDEAGFYRVRATPQTVEVERWIVDKLFPEAHGEGAARLTAPPQDRSIDAGSELDLESRIDEAPLVDDRAAQAFTALGDRLSAAKITAMLETGTTRVDNDQVFIRTQFALVLLAQQPWNAAQIQAAITSGVNGVWTTGSQGAGWRAGANGTQVLDGLGSLVLAVDGTRLILGDSVDAVNAILARRARPAIPGAVYEAGWRHTRELPNFERMMRLIDFPSIARTPDDGGDNSGRTPMFYSENIASFGRSLERVDSATVTVHDSGPLLRENVVYKVRP